MQAMDLARADAARENFTEIIRKLSCLGGEVSETLPELRRYTGMLETVQSLRRQSETISEETAVARQMRECLAEGIGRYQSCELALADNVEEAQALTGTAQEAAVWNTPAWAFTLLH